MKNEEFLTELVNVARRYGWDGDYVEVRDFVKWCHELFGKTPPSDKELEPLRSEDRED